MPLSWRRGRLPDVIESVSCAPSAPSRATTTWAGCRAHALELLEPLRELFKDEVRELGACSRCPKHVARQPSRPRLAIRVIGPVDEERCGSCAAPTRRTAEIRRADLYDTLWQAFAILLPVRTSGDGRRAHVRQRGRRARGALGRRMTADWARLPTRSSPATRRGSSTRCARDRVVYDVSSKPPAPSSGVTPAPARPRAPETAGHGAARGRIAVAESAADRR